MKDLHLKYHSETGMSHDRELYISHITSTKSARNFMIEPDGVKTLIVPTEDYLEWLEDLAEKYLKQDLSRVSKIRLKDELHRRKLRELNKAMEAERKSQNDLR